MRLFFIPGQHFLSARGKNADRFVPLMPSILTGSIWLLGLWLLAIPEACRSTETGG